MSLTRVGAYGGAPLPTAGRGRAEALGPAAFGESLDRLLDLRPEPAAAQSDPTAAGGLRFSRHAKARLESRGIELSPADLHELNDAIDRLHDRGARESLVLQGDNAWVVGIPTRTIITVMPRAEALGTVFTNIDSTFVAK